MYRGKSGEPLAEYRDRRPRASSAPQPSFPSQLFTSAYVKDNRLFIVGLCPCKEGGVIPFKHHAKIQGEVKNGPIYLGSKDLHPAIVKVLQSAEGPIMHQIEKEKMKGAAKNLVDRARLGEQNAEATLIAIRESAKKGNQRAQLAFVLCTDYAKEPTRPTLSAGPDYRESRPTKVGGFLDGPVTALRSAIAGAKNPVHYAATVTSHVPATGGTFNAAVNAASALSHGPTINTALLNSVRNAFGPEQLQKAFTMGVQFSGNVRKVSDLAKTVAKHGPELVKALQTGYSMGVAQRIQSVRKGGPLKHFSPIVAWELGE